MELMEKLTILADAAKYDVACTSSGVNRAAKKGMIGSATQCGICHSFAADGRCISLLKILLTNVCVYDCQYCVNRRTNDIPRAMFTPDEVAELTLNFYRRNYIEGLFLSSAVVKDPNYTMELIYKTVSIIRSQYKFNGYIHVKAIPGADDELVKLTGLVADRMSVNIEMPSEESLKLLAPDKSKDSILAPMNYIKNGIKQSKYEVAVYKNAPQFVPGGQSTQLIVGATPDTDQKIVTLAEGLYKKFSLKRVFYSAYLPVVSSNPMLTETRPPLLREHRLYQADFLLRFYKFKSNEILDDRNPMLNLNMDPKCNWAVNNISMFPLEVNTADYYELLRVPGIGQISAERIVSARKTAKLNFDNLKKLGIVLKRAKYFITCGGKMMERLSLAPEMIEAKLSENKISQTHEQLTLDTAVSYYMGLPQQTALVPQLI
jgi:putative DNA modification/repair radical SAM protein